MPRTVGTVYDRARALLNDQIGSVFTDIVLFPYFDLAYEEIRQELEDSNLSITNKTTASISIPTGITDIGGPTGPVLPNDFIEPLALWECHNVGSQDYVLMNRQRFLPKTGVLTAYLSVYSFADGYIHFMGATSDVQVKMDYVAIGLPDIVDDTTILKANNLILYLAFMVAAHASMWVGENQTRAAALNDKAVEARDRFENIQLKNSQNITTRRRPFMGNYKRNRSGWSR